MDSNNVKENLETLFEKFKNMIKVESVVGEAVTIGDATLVPFVDVTFGFGTRTHHSDSKQHECGGGGGGGGLPGGGGRGGPWPRGAAGADASPGRPGPSHTCSPGSRQSGRPPRWHGGHRRDGAPCPRPPPPRRVRWRARLGSTERWGWAPTPHP